MEAEPATSAGGASPEVLALAKVVSRLRAEVADLEAGAAAAAVLERASGVLMAREGTSAEEAHELLRERAARHDRTLTEECWLTLGITGRTPAFSPASQPPPAPVGAAPSPFDAARYAVRPGDKAQHALLARLADGLADASTASEVAQLLLLVLGDAEQVDAVMIYALGGSGSLELTGHAGFDPALTEQWSHVPPMAGVAAREALTEARAVWLENARLDADRYLLIDGPWPSRAWIPLPGERPATLAVGFFRTVAGSFSHDTRSLLRRAVRLCEGRLRASGRPGAPASTAEDDSVVAVQGIFDALSGPVVLLTPMRSADGRVEDFRIDAASAESVDVAGRRGRDLVGRRILETYPTVAGSDLWEGYLDTLTTGTVYEGPPFTYEETTLGVPYESVYSVRASPLGGRLVVCWIRHDTSEREARRLDDLQRLGNLGWASWNLTTDTITWSDQVYTIFVRDPRLGPVPLEELPAHLVPDDLARLGAAVQRLLGDGTAIDEPFRIATVHGVRHLRIVAEAHADSAGTPVEVHGFFQDLTAQRGTEIALHESERANLVQRGMLKAERALAARLQETLLPIPEQSLDLTDLRVDVAYLPADTGVNVGGDWYSAIELPDGGALFVVGDVAGHGLTAVGTMAQLRFTGKGMVITGSKLPIVLSRLNALLLHTATESYSATATMVMARYQPEDHQLTWVRAGHLPPLLIRDGAARYLPQPEGCLLGASFEAPYGQASLTLVPGDHLVLYTDGLVEVPHEDIDEGLTRLADTAARLVREGNARTLARTLAGGRPRHRDDICVLDIHLPRPESSADEAG
ncbi:SpoIIE family protein phosphatase [Streptomyces sp. NPDC056194]|uniref:SpoIIE family protein phosphatase n=1 Tax=unclassified Streptomyces TaxID=2593676 RepID=UPI0035DB0B28